MSEARTIRTELDGFERDPETRDLYLIFPVPDGKYRIGAPVTITFEEDPR